jgi:hypothetical protein
MQSGARDPKADRGRFSYSHAIIAVRGLAAVRGVRLGLLG